MSNAINGKDSLSPRELCNPFKLEISCVTIIFFQLFRWKQRIINKFGFDSILDKSLKSTSFSNDVKDLTWTLEFKLECVEDEMTKVTWKGEAWESNRRGNSKDYSSRKFNLWEGDIWINSPRENVWRSNQIFSNWSSP